MVLWIQLKIYIFTLRSNIFKQKKNTISVLCFKKVCWKKARMGVRRPVRPSERWW